MAIKKYVKKPIPVEVVKFEYSQKGLDELARFMGAAMGRYNKDRHILAKGELEIKTLEDGEYLKVKHIATEGDYIVKGYAGEFWSVKPEIFEATYEEADNGNT